MKTSREWTEKLIPAFMQDWKDFCANFTGAEEAKPVNNVETIVKEIQADASTSRPDDEMPISEEWLLSVGFIRLNAALFSYPRGGGFIY